MCRYIVSAMLVCVWATSPLSGQDGSTDVQDKAGTQSEKTETLREAWVGKLDMGVMKPVMQFRIVELADGSTKAYFDSVTEGQTGFAASWKIEDDVLTFKVSKIRLEYTGKLNDAKDKATGTWKQARRSFPLTLQKQSSAYKDAPVWENRPQRPLRPYPYSEEEVRFENSKDKLTLAGTLTIPKKSGKHPVVILISGSGPQDRDETLMGHKPFLVLADYLSRRGVAVLRYDDRGTAKSTGKYKGATIEDFATDASAAVDFLKKHPRIDPAQIGLAGHSEGGLVAPMVENDRDDVAFVILLATTGVDGKTISITQQEAMLRANGVDENEIKIAQAMQKAVFEVALNSESKEDMTTRLEAATKKVVEMVPESAREEAKKNLLSAIPQIQQQLTRPWFRHFVSYDPKPAIAKLRCPTLAIVGSKDTQLLPEVNLPMIKQALVDGKNGDFLTLRLEGLNHLFQKCKTGSMDEYANIDETFNPEALEVIGDWLLKRVKLAK